MLITSGLETVSNNGNGNYNGNWIFQTIGNGKGDGHLEASVEIIPVFLLALVCLLSDSRVRRKTDITVSAHFGNGITVSVIGVTVIPAFLLTLGSKRRKTRANRKTGITSTEASK